MLYAHALLGLGARARRPEPAVDVIHRAAGAAEQIQRHRGELAVCAWSAQAPRMEQSSRVLRRATPARRATRNQDRCARRAARNMGRGGSTSARRFGPHRSVACVKSQANKQTNKQTLRRDGSGDTAPWPPPRTTPCGNKTWRPSPPAAHRRASAGSRASRALRAADVASHRSLAGSGAHSRRGRGAKSPQRL